MSDVFQCDHCGGIFPCGDEEEAIAEAKREWGEEIKDVHDREEVAILCDDCHTRFMAWWRAKKN